MQRKLSQAWRSSSRATVQRRGSLPFNAGGRQRSTATPNTSLGAPKGGGPIDSVGIVYRASDRGRGAHADLAGTCSFIGFTTYPMRISENGTLGRDRPRFGGPARIELRVTNEKHFQKVRESKSFEFPPVPKSRHSKDYGFERRTPKIATSDHSEK